MSLRVSALLPQKCADWAVAACVSSPHLAARTRAARVVRRVRWRAAAARRREQFNRGGVRQGNLWTGRRHRSAAVLHQQESAGRFYLCRRCCPSQKCPSPVPIATSRRSGGPLGHPRLPLARVLRAGRQVAVVAQSIVPRGQASAGGARPRALLSSEFARRR